MKPTAIESVIIGIVIFMVFVIFNAANDNKKSREKERDEFQKAQAWLIENCKSYHGFFGQPKYVCLKYGIVTVDQYIAIKKNPYVKN